jgi:hypothetical protein
MTCSEVHNTFLIRPKDGGYVKLYGEDGEVPPALEAKFREYVGVWFLCEFIEHEWREQTLIVPDEALERRWMAFYAVGESVRWVYNRTGGEFREALQKLCDPS